MQMRTDKPSGLHVAGLVYVSLLGRLQAVQSCMSAELLSGCLVRRHIVRVRFQPEAPTAHGCWHGAVRPYDHMRVTSIKYIVYAQDSSVQVIQMICA